MAKWTPESSRPGTSRSRGCPAPEGEEDHVEVAAQVARGDVFPDGDARLEADPFGFHLANAPVQDVLLQLEVGDAVAQEPADLR